MKWPIVASISFLFALTSAALAQTQTIERHVKGKPDANITAGIFTSVRPDCTAGPLPVIRLVTPPAHGKVTMKEGRLRATNLKQCLGLEAAAFIAIYRSASDFIGEDSFVLEVKAASGKSWFERVTVTIGSTGLGQGI